MPTYDYKCKKCGITFELFQKMSDEPIKNCIECNGEVKRMVGSGLTPIFKGSGFYETDYKAKSNKNVSNTKAVSSKNSENGIKKENVSSENKDVKSDTKNSEPVASKKADANKSE